SAESRALPVHCARARPRRRFRGSARHPAAHDRRGLAPAAAHEAITRDADDSAEAPATRLPMTDAASTRAAAHEADHAADSAEAPATRLPMIDPASPRTGAHAADHAADSAEAPAPRLPMTWLTARR